MSRRNGVGFIILLARMMSVGWISKQYAKIILNGLSFFWTKWMNIRLGRVQKNR